MYGGALAGSEGYGEGQTYCSSNGVGCKESDSLNRGESSVSEPCQDGGDIVGWLWNGQIGSGGERWWATGKEFKARCSCAVGNSNSSGEMDTGSKALENSRPYYCAYKSPALRPDLRKTGNWPSVMSSILKTRLELVKNIEKVIYPPLASVNDFIRFC